MSMLRDLLIPFQSAFSKARLGRERAHWFIFTLLAVIVPFTSSMSSCDSWFGNNGLWGPLQHSGQPVHLLSRLRSNTALYAQPEAPSQTTPGRHRKYGHRCESVGDLAAPFCDQARTYTVLLYGKQREVRAYDQIFMLKNLRCPVRVVWVFRKTQWVAFFTTDLNLSVTEIIEYYGARWKIEAGFKEIKQDIGSARSQTRTADAVTNHLQFCLMATTLTWIYADRITPDPERRHKVKGRTSFAFSDVRRLIADEALSDPFLGFWPDYCQPLHKSFTQALMRMVA